MCSRIIEELQLWLARTVKGLRFHPRCKLISEPATASCGQKPGDSQVRDKGPCYPQHSKEQEFLICTSSPFTPSPSGTIQRGPVGLCHSRGNPSLATPIVYNESKQTGLNFVLEGSIVLILLDSKQTCSLLRRETLSLSSKVFTVQISLQR